MPKITEDDLLAELAKDYPEELSASDVTLERFMERRGGEVSWSAAYRYLEKKVQKGELVKVKCFDTDKHRRVVAYRRP